MSDSKPLVKSLWVFVGSGLVSLLYFASLGPATWCQTRGLFPPWIGPRALQVYYAPAHLFMTYGPDPAVRGLSAYMRQFQHPSAGMTHCK